jgi:hypothetical protein
LKRTHSAKRGTGATVRLRNEGNGKTRPEDAVRSGLVFTPDMVVSPLRLRAYTFRNSNSSSPLHLFRRKIVAVADVSPITGVGMVHADQCPMWKRPVLKLALLCAVALAIRAVPTPRISAGLELYSLRMAFSMGGPPVHLRTGASEIGQSHDISLTIDMGNDR